jgi:hypothetical protein
MTRDELMIYTSYLAFICNWRCKFTLRIMCIFNDNNKRSPDDDVIERMHL